MPSLSPTVARALVVSLCILSLPISAQAELVATAAGSGFESVLWFGFLVFVILLVTDILGFTKVFSFTRPVK
jgi:hypothetical protein